MRRVALALVAVALAAGAAACTPSSSKAVPTPTTSTRVPRSLRFVSMNVLHGAVCDDGPGHCAVAARMQLLAREIEAAHCPDVIGLEEVAPWWRALLVAGAKTLCGGAYHVVSPPIRGPYLDAETILSRRPTAGARRFELASRVSMRRALRVSVAASIGRIVVVVTHAGTGADDFGNGGARCADATDCPPPCNPAASAFTCQIIQLRDIAEANADNRRVATIVAGDFNLVPTARPLQVLRQAGFVDTYRATGRAECNRSTGAGCTSGRDDTHLATLRNPAARDDVRVDDIFLLPTARCRPAYGPATGLFDAQPAANGPDGLAWVSDHVGVELELTCR